MMPRVRPHRPVVAQELSSQMRTEDRGRSTSGLIFVCQIVEKLKPRELALAHSPSSAMTRRLRTEGFGPCNAGVALGVAPGCGLTGLTGFAPTSALNFPFTS